MLFSGAASSELNLFCERLCVSSEIVSQFFLESSLFSLSWSCWGTTAITVLEHLGEGVFLSPPLHSGSSTALCVAGLGALAVCLLSPKVQVCPPRLI